MSNGNDEGKVASNSVERENEQLRAKLLQFQALEEELIAKRVFDSARGRLKAWITVGGLAIFVLGVLGVKGTYDWYKSMQARIETNLEQVVTSVVERSLTEDVVNVRFDAALEARLTVLDDRIVSLDQGQARLADELTVVRIAAKDMESCTEIDPAGGDWRVTNTCDQAVVLRFAVRDRPVIERELLPRDSFDTGVSSRMEYIFTTCPVGYVSSVPISEENWDTIGFSHYTCVKE